MNWDKLHKLVEAINTYYAFAVLLYVAALYVAGHSQLFWWVLLALTPIIAGWTGYLLKSYLTLNRTHHGFKLVSDAMTYEVKGNHHYGLKYKTLLQAASNHVLVYPIGYQWTGSGDESLPIVEGPDMQIAGVVERRSEGTTKIVPHKEIIPPHGEWHYWFVGLRPAAYKDDLITVKYSQEFYDKKHSAKPCLFYPIKHPMGRLELNVKFSTDTQPKKVTCSYIKLSDSRRSYLGTGMEYDADKKWATWVIEKPKKGYCYRIQWEY